MTLTIFPDMCQPYAPLLVLKSTIHEVHDGSRASINDFLGEKVTHLPHSLRSTPFCCAPFRSAALCSTLLCSAPLRRSVWGLVRE